MLLSSGQHLQFRPKSHPAMQLWMLSVDHHVEMRDPLPLMPGVPIL